MTGEMADAPSGASLFRRAALGLGPLLFAGLLIAGPPEGLTDPAWRALALLAWMVVWWIGEAVPVAATALLPLAVLPLAGVATPQAAAAPYADPILYMFIGGFILAAAIERCGLHRRIALMVLSRVGGGPGALVAGFMLATALLSMWISNTATTLMMVPIAVAVCAGSAAPGEERRRLSAACVLGIAYAASIGGLGTPVGSPTNLVGLKWLESAGHPLSFVDWMMIGVPLIAVTLPVAWLILARGVYKLSRASQAPADALAQVRADLAALGAMSPAETRTASVFIAVALGWMLREPLSGLPGLSQLTDMGIAITGAIALFVIPAGDKARPGAALLDWRAAEAIPWGIVVLFGGGLSMAAALGVNGVPAWVAGQMGGIGAMPTWAVVALLALVTVFLSELSSNVATLTTMLPVVSAIIAATGADPLVVGASVTFAASFGFMLPIATAPNSIAFATGLPRQSEMIRAGLLLNLAGILVIAVVVSGIASLLG
jgi:sodium-dependent dicarboxylate transporter 2/3/5